MRIKEILKETTWQDIWALNKAQIPDPNRIFPGQEIKLPNGTSTHVDKGDTLSRIALRFRKGWYNPGTAVDNAQQAAPTGPKLAPEGTVLKAAQIPWRKAGFPHYANSDMVKRNGQWWSQGNSWSDPKPTQATQPAWIDQLEMIWANSLKG